MVFIRETAQWTDDEKLFCTRIPAFFADSLQLLMVVSDTDGRFQDDWREQLRSSWMLLSALRRISLDCDSCLYYFAKRCVGSVRHLPCEATDVVWERYQESILPYIMCKHAVVEKRGGVGQSVDE